jgi:NADPH:quinone reductase-like Zn-dependent oxidoreductase
MRAFIYRKSGSLDNLQLKEVEKPVPKDNELLIKVYATTVTAGDVAVRSFKSQKLFWILIRIMYGLKRPKRPILGSELAGEIEPVSKDVKRFRTGDKVFASTGMCFGANAEYVCIPEDGVLAMKPVKSIICIIFP